MYNSAQRTHFVSRRRGVRIPFLMDVLAGSLPPVTSLLLCTPDSLTDMLLNMVFIEFFPSVSDLFIQIIWSEYFNIMLWAGKFSLNLIYLSNVEPRLWGWDLVC